MVSALALLAATHLFPYPGTTYLGELKGKEGSCRVAAWEGIAPGLWLFTEEEKKALEAIRRDVEGSETSTDPAKAASAALGRFLRLVNQGPAASPPLPASPAAPSPLFSGKRVDYLSLALRCGEEVVRAGLAVLPQLHGVALVAVHPSTGSHLWIGDFVLKPEKVRELLEAAREQRAATGEAAQANAAKPTAAAPKGEGEEGEKLEKLLEMYHSRAWTIAGRTLRGCAEECDPAELQAAWAALPAAAQQAFKPLLGALSRTAAEEAGEFTPPPPGTLLVPRLLLTWPSFLGDNPFLEGQWEVQAVAPKPSFAAPSAPLSQEIFGTQRPRPPEFDNPHPARVYTVIYKSIR